MSKTNRSRLISILVILGSMVLVAMVAFSNGDLKDAWGALRGLDAKWLAAGFGLYAGYVFFEGLGLHGFLQAGGWDLRLSTAIHFTFAGLFYANVTPGSSGGQPMQVYLMRQRAIPVGTATSALTVRFFFNQLSVSLIVLAGYLTQRAFCARQLGGVAALIVIGWLINFAAVPLVLLAMLNRPWIERLGARLLAFCGRRRWVRDPETLSEQFHHLLDQYEAAIRDLLYRPWQIVVQLVTSLCEMLCLLLVPVAVYHALGLSGTPWYQLLTVSAMLFVSASYTPLPGASGAQEGGFLLYFHDLYTGGTISVALLVWRFITFYLCVFLGAADALWTNLRKRRAPLSHRRHRGVSSKERGES